MPRTRTISPRASRADGAYLRCRRVAHRLGERREAGEIDEQDRGPQLRRHLRRALEARLLLHVQNDVLPRRLLHSLLVKVQQDGLDQRFHAVARRIRDLDEFPAGESSRLQPLVHVEVKEANLRLGDAAMDDLAAVFDPDNSAVARRLT